MLRQRKITHRTRCAANNGAAGVAAIGSRLNSAMVLAYFSGPRQHWAWAQWVGFARLQANPEDSDTLGYFVSPLPAAVYEFVVAGSSKSYNVQLKHNGSHASEICRHGPLRDEAASFSFLTDSNNVLYKPDHSFGNTHVVTVRNAAL